MDESDPIVGEEDGVKGVACFVGWTTDNLNESEVAEAFQEGRWVVVSGVFQVEVEVTEEDVVGCPDEVGSNEIHKVVAEFSSGTREPVGKGSLEGGGVVCSYLEV